MLKGQFTLSQGTAVSHYIRLHGYDINGVYDMEVVPRSEETLLALDNGFLLGNGLTQGPSWGLGANTGCHIRVALGKVGVAKYAIRDYTAHQEYYNKGTAVLNDLNEEELAGLPVITNSINKDFWYIIGSVLRGLREACVPINRADYHELSSNVNDINTSIQYNINIPQGQGTAWGRGVVVLENSLTKSIEFKGNFSGYDVSLSLYDDGSSSYNLPFTSQFHYVAISSAWSEPPRVNTVGMLDSDGFYSVDDIIEQNKGKKSYEWLKTRNYIIVDKDNFKEAVTAIYNHGKAGGLIAFDTETTGLFISNQSRQGEGDQLVGMVFSISQGTAYYFPVAHTEFPNIGEGSQINHLMDRYFKPILERFRILTHNGSFDWKVMHIYDINTNIVADTRIAAFLTVSHLTNNKKISTGLKSLTQEYLHRDSLELDDFVDGSWGSTGLTFANLPKESVRYYACADTDNTLALWEFFEGQGIIDMFGARKEVEIECLFTRAVGYSEFYGMYANPDNIHTLEKELSLELEELSNQIYSYAGEQFNISSPKQKSHILFDKMGVPVIKKTATGAPSTDKKSLKAALRQLDADSNAYKLVEALLKYAEVNILHQNFASKYDVVNEKLGRTNFVKGFSYSSVTQFLETGRLSVNGPNYQSYNDSVKKYITPRDGYYICDFDYGAIEYRTLVSVAGEEDLIQKFHDPDYDYHRSMASMIHGIPYDEVTAELRSKSKGINFGIPYGMSIKALAELLGVSYEEAEHLYNKYFEVQPRVRAFFNKQKEFAVENSYNTTYFGRRRTYDKRKDNINRIKRMAGNFPIQGTAADIYKLGIGRLFLKIIEKGYLGKILITAFVHDEAVIECHNTINPAEVLGIVQEAMMIEIDGWCPLYIGCGFGTSWYDAKKIELPVQVQNDIVARKKLAWWEGDRTKLKLWAEGEILNFKVTYLKEYLTNPENHNKVMGSVAYGHLVELLGAVSRGTAETADSTLAQKGVGLLYTKDMQSYTFERKKVNDNLREFGQLFNFSKEVESANILEAEEPTQKAPKKVKPEDISFTTEDPLDLATEHAMLSGCGLETTSKVLVVLGYQAPEEGQLEDRYSRWNSTVVGVLQQAPPGAYGVYLAVTTPGTASIALKPTQRTVSPLTASQLIRAYNGHIQAYGAHATSTNNR